MKRSWHILPTIVIAQFCCTSLWFASNAVLPDLTSAYQLNPTALGHLTSAVQLGFITGTLCFAILTIADRYSPSKVFFYCALIGGLINLASISPVNTYSSLLGIRFLAGFSLAGIYPVGMKIAADYFEKGLGISLGYLVGALVLGTALPHALNGLSSRVPWQSVIWTTSGLAILGGVLMMNLVPNGPFRKQSPGFDYTVIFKVFRVSDFRRAAFGYFGHMWELYAFWAFVPVMLLTYQEMHPDSHINIPIASFSIIGLGGVACVVGGYLSQRWSTRKVAFSALLMSCLCCLLSPLFFALNATTFIGFLIVWGLVVIADSPLFSTMVAHSAHPETKGTALTITNSIGFAITIVSIQILNILTQSYSSPSVYTILALGPIIGLYSLLKK